MKPELMNYWFWFLHGTGVRPGYRRILNVYLVIHLILGAIVAFIVPADLTTSANTVLFPFAGIFVGLSFAWAGNAQALLQSSEISSLSEYHEGGFVEYVFVYQTAILIILVTLVAWGIAGLDVFHGLWPTTKMPVAYFTVKVILFALCSLTIRECWHVVMGAQWMLIAQREIRLRMSKHDSNDRT